jgi:hypothetical protein
MITNRLTAIAAIALGAAGCATIALAPGAEKVRITDTAGDVASCKVVGNVVSQDASTEALKNQTLGLGGNTLLYTGASGSSVEGLAYSCP